MAPGRTRIGRMRSFDSKNYQASLRLKKQQDASEGKDTANESEKTGAPEDTIIITPDHANISPRRFTSKHTMVNQCDRKLAFKVHSLNNSHYTVFGGCAMVAGFIDGAETKEFVIKRKTGKPQQPDTIIICFCDATGPDPLEHFEGEPKSEVVGETLIKLSAAE